jgi:hypothetical protein
VEGGAAVNIGLHKKRTDEGGNQMEPAKLKTSIGIVHAEAEGRDRLTLKSPHQLREARPYLWLTLARDGDLWEFTEPPLYHPEPAENECIKEVRMPPALAEEILTLGRDWAASHPDEFERAARAEFDDMLIEIVDETFDEITRICSDATKRFRRILDAPEFANYASTPLRRRVQKEAQRLRVMRLQVSGAAKAISTLAGRRPSGAENQTAAQ